jgi:adenine-specific DNA-methyltransferase
MAKKESAKKPKQTSGLLKPVEVYEHTGSKRLNNPQVGLVNTKTEQAEKKRTYQFDPHIDPQLQWSSKAERTSFEIPVVSLHVHERMDPKTVIEAVKKYDGINFEQLNLFNRPINKLTFVKEIQFYQHEKDWTNRLISGDSLLVMNSLLEKEGLAEKVQTIYFDPPYGIRYGSNFQPFVNNKDVKDGKDQDLTSEPETLRAFRDTWELGIHSYLSYIRDRLLLAKDLLKPEGSLFFQIGDENVHHVREILDEIFGSENFVSLITFKKIPYQETNYLANVCDYILWYAKDKSRVKINKLYVERTREDIVRGFDLVEKPDGTVVRVGSLENPTGNERFFRAADLTSKGASDVGSAPFTFQGKEYRPKEGNHWKTHREGLNQLAKLNRLIAFGKTLCFKKYADDFPFTSYSNIWTDTIQSTFSTENIYVVQTYSKVIERCLLMTTDPGDLVLDPTCGSGTSAFVAEKWGRRWITCDTSRVAITLAKQRLLTSVFEYYKLKMPDEGISSGLEYEQYSKTTLGSLANREHPEVITLIDRPINEKTKARITGPFTVEAVPAPVTREVGAEELVNRTLNGVGDWIQELLRSGIRSKNKNYLKLSRLEPMQGTRWIHADGSTQEEVPQRIVVSFGPDFAPLEQRQVELALQEAEKLKPSPTVVAFAAFQFDPEAAHDIDNIEWGGVSVLKVQMNADLFTGDLKKKRSSNESFWLVGQPDIKLEKIKSSENRYRVFVNGFDYYNPKTGTMNSGGSEQIAMWLLDTDYDGRSMLPRQVFFPMSGDKDGWTRLAKTLRSEIDQELIESYRGVESLPFAAGEHKRIALKIVDDRGIESLIVKDLE